jgi:cysteine desulfurase
VLPIYLDTAATTPMDPRVRAHMLQYLDADFGNAGSRTHDYGRRARSAVEQARHHVAVVAGASRGDVVFTSGATESNNLALLGLAPHGVTTARRHIVSTAIEHHAVHEPLRVLEQRGFQITLVPPTSGGAVSAEAIVAAVRPDTLLVSVMHVNNETGVVQDVDTVAAALAGRDTFLHVDAAQGYGKAIVALRHERIDLVSVSGHKIGAPKGVGALIIRRRDGARPPLEPLMYGGGQERGLRPGTIPVALVAALGRAAELALAEHKEREASCRAMRLHLLAGLAPLQPDINGNDHVVPHILNVSFPGIDAETVIEAWRDLVAISNGAACTSAQYTCSHVLSAMRLSPERIEGAVRLSWQHDTPLPPIEQMVLALEKARASLTGP